MKIATRWLLAIALIFAAISFYAMGTFAGVFVLIAVGFILEGTAFSLLFKKRKKKPAPMQD